jgi:serine/threonine protein kinase/formylglycine-generating enzyme required for sulfatase activity/pimeloyl-ACP methyl ester carboxylesterase
VIGKKLAHYEIVELLGKGGMGAVYRARDDKLERDIALKILPPELTRSAENTARFQREARLAASLNHPNIATIHDVGEEGGVTYFVMELLRGDSLRDLVTDAPLSITRSIDIATGIAAGLSRAHDAGVVHRDLKPDNIVFDDEGIPKILDFGVGKLLDETDRRADTTPEDLDAATVAQSPQLTQHGQVVGTLAYMSPEQIQGQPVDVRADVFSFGILLYEMLAGARPFAGTTGLETATAILRDAPAPLDEMRKDVPPALADVLDRCLAKDPAERFPSGAELHAALVAAKPRLQGPERKSVLQQPAVLAVLVGLLVVSGIGVTWMLQGESRESWARNEALPEIERLWSEGDRDAAIRLVYEAERIIPDDERLRRYISSIAVPVDIESEPSGATVYVKGYNHPEREWIRVGETPITRKSVGMPVRMRVEKEGYVPYQGAPFHMKIQIALFPEAETPSGMVPVQAGSASMGDSDSIPLDAFWIDRYEVTNQQFKAFMDAGGYREDRYWDANIDRSRLVDSTGRPAPADWTLGDYPEGEGDFPVGGVSLFEAKAYAAWAQKSLPSVFHWRLAANQGIFSEILRWSNFDVKGPARVGSYDSLGPSGTYDMAGNVREWCLNRTGDRHYVLGGAWSDPDYLYRGTDTADPYERSSFNGFRCVQTAEPIRGEALQEIRSTVYDHRQDVAIDDATYAIVARSFDYDQRDFDVEAVATDDSMDDWRHETVTIQAAYGGERLPVHLFLPKNAEPPYQTVVYFPPSSALYHTDSSDPSFPFAYFIPKSGRALIYPIYKGTYERAVDISGPNDRAQRNIHIGKDLRRAVDYLESRDDIDLDKLAYCGMSWGASMGPIMTAIEPRFTASILIAGGLSQLPESWPPVVASQNFAPRSKVPTLLINGRADLGSPIETNIQPMFEMLGTPPEHKRLAVLEGGHVPSSPNEVIREVLDWLDRYLGPVWEED